MYLEVVEDDLHRRLEDEGRHCMEQEIVAAEVLWLELEVAREVRLAFELEGELEVRAMLELGVL